MTDSEIKIARRIAAYMLEIAEQQVDLHFFQGLGLALAVCYEELTGYSSRQIKPRELLEWAKNLPQVSYPHVI